MFHELAQGADATLVIAPETAGVLAERRRMTDAAGGRFLGPTAEAIELCGDKLSLFELLVRHSIPTIPTSRIESFDGSPPYPFPIVVKPRDGAGSVDTVLIRGADEFRTFLRKLCQRRPLTPDPSPAGGAGERVRTGGPAENRHSEMIVQPFITGRALSTAALVDVRDGRIDILPVGEQRLTNDGGFGYRGGRIPADDLTPALAAAAVDLVGEVCGTLTGLTGWIGVDLIVSSKAPQLRIVEVNPRLTTSYVGYRRLTGANLAARILACDEAGDPVEWNLIRPSPCVEFDADGTVRDI